MQNEEGTVVTVGARRPQSGIPFVYSTVAELLDDRRLFPGAAGCLSKVRELVVDALTPAELRDLRTASERILERIEASDPRPATESPQTGAEFDGVR